MEKVLLLLLASLLVFTPFPVRSESSEVSVSNFLLSLGFNGNTSIASICNSTDGGQKGVVCGLNQSLTEVHMYALDPSNTLLRSYTNQIFAYHREKWPSCTQSSRTLPPLLSTITSLYVLHLPQFLFHVLYSNLFI